MGSGGNCSCAQKKCFGFVSGSEPDDVPAVSPNATNAAMTAIRIASLRGKRILYLHRDSMYLLTA